MSDDLSWKLKVYLRPCAKLNKPINGRTNKTFMLQQKRFLGIFLNCDANVALANVRLKSSFSRNLVLSRRATKRKRMNKFVLTFCLLANTFGIPEIELCVDDANRK